MDKFLLVCSFYNNPEEHIDLTFNNVLKQTHKNWVLIVGDDFSSVPGFRGLLKRKVEELNDPRIIYYETKTKRELYLYQNTFQELKYDYYFDLDSDDIIHERTLELYHNNFIKYPEVTSIFSDFIKVSEKGEKEQYSTVKPSLDYAKEFNFRNNNSFEKIYSKRSGQQMFGVGRCMRKPTEDKIHIEKNCRTSTDSLFLFYNLNRGKHLHLPRRLYTYIKRKGSDSGKMSAKEYADFNTNANYYIDKLQPSLKYFQPYNLIWYETTALSTCDFLSQVDSLSLISDINSEQFELIKTLYPDKNLELNNFKNPNLVVAWDKLSPKLEKELEKVANACFNLSICKYNNDFTLKAGLPHNGKNTNITDSFAETNTKFAQSLSKFMSGYSWWSYFRFVIVTKSSLPKIEFIPKIKINKPFMMEDEIVVSFIKGAKVEVKGKSLNKYYVKFINKDTGHIIWSDTISPGMWTMSNKEYYINWKIEVWCNGELIKTYNFNCNNKRVYIHLDSKALGDSLAWVPYAEEFRKKHNCQVILSTFRNEMFKTQYPEIEFVSPGSVVPNIYAQFSIGWFWENHKNPTDVLSIPLQQTASDILGLEYKEIKPKLHTSFPTPKIKGKYVTLSMQSTSQAKYWNYKGGWQQVVDYLNKKGYKTVCIDRYPNFGVEGCMNTIPKNTIDKTGCNLEEASSLIKNASFHLGISSGLSWLAWALDTHTVMVSSFSHPICEFTQNITRIYNDNNFSGYFNTHRIDANNWHWNPFLNISTPEEWHDFESITPEQVINEINKIL